MEVKGTGQERRSFGQKGEAVKVTMRWLYYDKMSSS
jgi:hypothetical protein